MFFRRILPPLLFFAWLTAVLADGGAVLVRSAAEPDYPPLSVTNSDGKADGFAVELLQATLHEMGRDVTFRVGSWDEIKQELAAGRLDVLPLVGRTPEREALFDFTIPYLTLHGALFVRSDETAIRGWDDLQGRRLAVMKGDNAEEYVRRAGLSGTILTPPSFDEAFRMLATGQADAVVAQKLMGVSLIKQLGITNVRVVGRPNDEFKQDFCFGVREGNKELLAKLNEGLAIVFAKGINRQLEGKWMGVSARDAALARVIVYGGDCAYPPYEFLDEKGRPAGFNIDLARGIAREIGADITFHLAPWKTIRQKVETGEIDLTSMMYSPQRDRLVDFSLPHTHVCQAVFARHDSPTYRHIDDLKGQRISVQNQDIMHEYALEHGLGNALSVTATPQEALALLAGGKVDFSLGSHLQGMHWIKKNGWRNLRAVETRLLGTEYCFAVQEGNTALRDLFNDGLRHLQGSGDYHAIYNRWLGVLEPEYSRQRIVRFILFGVAAAALLAAIALGVIHGLRRQVQKRTAELEAANQELERSRSALLKLMEDAVHAKEKLQLTQFALDHSADEAFWINVSGRFAYVNEAACRSLGYTQAEFLKLSVHDIDPDFPADRWPQHWAELQQKRFLRFETLHRTRDGRVFPVEIHASFLSFEGVEYNCAFAHDITSRKQGEAERERLLAAAEQSRRVLLSVLDDEKRTAAERARLAAAIEQAAEIVVITDATGVMQYVNPAFERVTGFSRSEAVGQTPRILKSGRQDVAFYQQMWSTITAGQAWQGRFVNRRKDGTLYHEEATISPVRDPTGQIVSFVAVKRDISEHLLMADQLQQAQKMDSVGRLAGGVAHDFNNILQVILGTVELARESAKGEPQVLADLEDIRSQATRAADLTRQLLAFARKQTIAPKVLDLNDTISNMLKMLRRLIGEDIALSWEPGPNLWTVKMDPGQVDQLLANLCVNARDAITGVGKVIIGTENVTLDAAFCTRFPRAMPGEYVRLLVADTGCGMTQEVLAHVFEPFFTTKAQGRGTGLGLATVYGIVTQNAGWLDVESKPGQGTRFSLYLPRFAAEVPPVRQVAQAAAPPGGNETILVVEDEKSVREIARRILVQLGYTVVVAETPDAGLRLATEHKEQVRLLLTDVVMPGMNGQQLAKRVAEIVPGIRCLYMSGYTANAIAHRGVLDPGIRFLEKPFTRDALARKVREVLDSTRVTRDA